LLVTLHPFGNPIHSHTHLWHRTFGPNGINHLLNRITGQK
jgi:hypothetical protein